MVVIAGKDRLGRIERARPVVVHREPVEPEHRVDGLENVGSRRHRVRALQIPAERAVQIRPFVRQMVGNGLRVRRDRLLRRDDLEDPLRDEIFRPVRQKQPFQNADLLPEPYLPHGVVVFFVQIGKRDIRLPARAVLKIAGDRSLLEKRARPPVFIVVVERVSHTAARCKKFQARHLCEVGLQRVQIRRIPVLRADNRFVAHAASLLSGR